MKNSEIQQQFIALRADGRSFAHIAEVLQVSKPTLIDWSRKFQFEISNLKAVAAEALQERFVASREERLQFLVQNLKRVEAEINARDLTAVPTPKLFAIAALLRAQVNREMVDVQFSSPTRVIPDEEFSSQVVEWRP